MPGDRKSQLDVFIEENRPSSEPPDTRREPGSMGTLHEADWENIPTGVAKALEKEGFKVNRKRDRIAAAPATGPTSVAAPVVVAPAQPAHWLTPELVKTFWTGLGAVITGTFTALGLYRATAPAPPPPPPPADIVCPPYADRDAPRVAICHRIDALEDGLGSKQAHADDQAARDEREKALKQQQPAPPPKKH